MTGFALTPPDPVEPVPAERVAGLVPLPDDVRAASESQAERLAGELVALDPRSPAFADRVDELMTLGENDMRTAASIASALLDRAASALSDARGRAPGPEQMITSGLAELRRTAAALDPKDLVVKRRAFNLVPVRVRGRAALARFREAEGPMNRLVLQLRSHQDQLRRDNAAIKGERTRLWDTMGRLGELVALAEALDGAVERQAGVLDLADPAKATALRSEVLHPVRQRHQDLLTQLAVCAQGYLALDLVRRNNDELIRGVERATTTTVSALRLALVITGALNTQGAVLHELDGLRGTTDALIRSNAEVIGMHGEQIRRASSDPAVGVDTIRASFDQIYAAIDAIDVFRASAAEAMSTTVAALRGEVRRAEEHLRRPRAEGE